MLRIIDCENEVAARYKANGFLDLGLLRHRDSPESGQYCLVLEG